MVEKFKYDVDDSGDILLLTLLRRWIRFSPIVNPLYLISYTFIIQYVYKLDVIPWSSGTATCWRFYTCLPQGVCIAGPSNSVCLHYVVYLYYIEYACYVNQLISKANFEVFIWTKKRTKIFLYFCPRSLKWII